MRGCRGWKASGGEYCDPAVGRHSAWLSLPYLLVFPTTPGGSNVSILPAQTMRLREAK